MDFEITFFQGGMLETFETGIYPEWLIIRNKSLKRKWRIRCKHGKKKGVLLLDKIPTYRFSFRSMKGCTITELTSSSPQKTVTFHVAHILCD